MADPIIDATTIGKLAGGMLAGGGVTSIAGAVEQLLLLINHLSRDNPAKATKARREVHNILLRIIKEIPNADQKDVSDLVAQFSDVMDAE